MDIVKQWQCKNEHVIGYVARNGARVAQLMVLRHAIDAGADEPAEVDVMMGPVTGEMQVRCDVCGEVTHWRVSVESLLFLVEGMPADLLFRFWGKLLERAKGVK